MELNQILTVGILLAVTGIALVFTMDIVGDVKDDYTAQSLEANLSGDVQDSLANISTKMPLIATVVVAAILIGLLLRFGSFSK